MDRIHLRDLAERAKTSDETMLEFHLATTPTKILELLDQIDYYERIVLAARRHWRMIAGDPDSPLPSAMHKVLNPSLPPPPGIEAPSLFPRAVREPGDGFE